MLTTEELLVSPKEAENNEITIGFVSTKKSWDWNKIIIDDNFSFTIALHITNDDENVDPKTIEECRH